jgi:hypothetical protein
MLRVTMIRTMPVAMIATGDAWTDRFRRLTGVRNALSEASSMPIRIAKRAATIPNSRRSTSV